MYISKLVSFCVGIFIISFTGLAWTQTETTGVCGLIETTSGRIIAVEITMEGESFSSALRDSKNTSSPLLIRMGLAGDQLTDIFLTVETFGSEPDMYKAGGLWKTKALSKVKLSETYQVAITYDRWADPVVSMELSGTHVNFKGSCIRKNSGL